MSKIDEPYNKIIRDYFPKDLNIQPMSKKTKQMFTSILSGLREGNQSWTDNSNDIVSLGIDYIKKSDFVGRGTYNYIPNEIRDKIEKSSVYQAVYSFHINKRVYRGSSCITRS